ncbi:MAG: ATP-binding protein, partial [Bacteroidales bacterium]|nr:ATP-binding protein [Bacteroidales bacterium]
KYRNSLEMLVKERTEELETTNEELQATNEEIYNHKEELQTALTKLQSTQQQLVQSEKMATLGVLAAGVAHEINNPLNFIHGGVTALEKYIKDSAAEHLKELSPLVEIINTGVSRAVGIVEGLSHYSRSDELQKVIDCNIHKIIDNCLLMLDNKIKKRIVVDRKYSIKLTLVSCKEGKMHQAFLNILTNAVQAIEGEGTITITTSQKNRTLIVAVTDSGCGISKQNISKITDPFFTTKDPGKGTGLGLSITQNIIEEHNGKIIFDSEPGVGTTVTVRLPLNG